MAQKAEWKALKRKRCKQCRELFKPYNPEQEFCKTKCRQTWHKEGAGMGARIERILLDKFAALESKVREIIRSEVRRAIKEERAAERAKRLGKEQPTC